jgi:hypothetical protein
MSAYQERISWVGRRVRKFFEGRGFYFGHVSSYSPGTDLFAIR